MSEPEPLHEHVFETAGFASCHAPTLAVVGEAPGAGARPAQLGAARVLAAWFGGSREGRPDVGIYGAVRAGGRWSTPERIARVRESAHWNPVLFATPGGRVHLFFKVGDRIPDWETWVCHSDDGGETWSVPRELVPGDRGGRGPVKNRPLRLASGAWLAPGSVETARHWNAFVDRSEDQGLTWRRSDVPLARPFPGKGVIQPALWESAPGRVHMLLRSTCGRICRSDSTDDGLTWSPAERTDVPNNNSGLDVARLPSGSLVLAHNPVSGRWGARTPLVLSHSHDGGATWFHWETLESGPGEFSYPTVAAFGGLVLVVYTWRRERIAFWCGSEAEISSAE